MNNKRIKTHTSKTGITIIGELLVDQIYDLNNKQVHTLFGGSPGNIAVNLIDLGIDNVMLFSAIGNDEKAELIIKTLEEKGVSTKNINRVAVPTSVVRIDKTTDTPIPEFDRAADYLLEYTDELDKAIKNSAIVHFSYWPLSRKPSLETIRKVIEKAKEYKTLIGFDPNYHEALVNKESVDMEELKIIMSNVDITKPSLDDATRILGEIEPNEIIKKLADSGVMFTILTLGKDGFVANYKNKTYKQKSLAKEVVDATGAGDAFYSGLYSAILNNEDIETVLQVANACSAYNLSRIGGISHLPKYRELKKEFNIGE